MPRRKATTKTVAKPKKEKVKQNKKFNRLRGMKDIMFDDYEYWDLVTKKASELTRAYDFKRVETPILEKSDLFQKATGDTTDIVTKEMYSFVDKNGDKIALRPEATPGLVRAYIEHGMFNLPQPVKMFWLGPIFRHEKPQSGRYRQAHQIDLEIFGEESPVADVLVILIAYNFFKELQISTQVQVNSIGCKDCRKEYIDSLLDFYKERGKRSKLCNDCKKRINKNPLRLLDCKEKACVEVREDAPQIVDFLCDDCREHFIKVLEYLDELEVPYNLNSYLVRGLDYYNRTVFEFWPNIEKSESGEDNQENEDKSSPLSLGGGGRYDGLVEYLGGRPTPACGIGIGIERTIMTIKENNIPINKNKEDLIFIAQLGDQARRRAMTLFEELRRSGYKVRQAFTRDNLKSQLEEANRKGVKLSLILGQKEVMDNTILLRDMDSGIQEVIDYKKVTTEIEKRLNSLNTVEENGKS